MSIVQSIVFNKSYGLKNARAWLAKNGYGSHYVDEKEETYRFRQYDPSSLENHGYRFRTTPFEHGNLIIAYPPEKK